MDLVLSDHRVNLILRLLGWSLGLYLTQLVVYHLYTIFIYPYYVSPLRHLPGPKDHHFLIGQSLKQFKSGSPNEPFVSWMRKWPDAPFIRYFGAGNSEALLVTSLAAHKEILQAKCYSFEKPPFFTRLIADIVGLGLVFAIGPEHKKQRRFLNDLFSISNLKSFIPVFRAKAQDLARLFEKAVDDNDGVVELVSVYSRIMLDIMGVFALGVELNNLESTTSYSFYDCYHEVFEPDTVGQILVAINAFLPIRWLPIGANRRFKHANNIVRSQLLSIIRQRIADVQANGKEGDSSLQEGKVKDLLTSMVESKYFAREDKWTESDILDQTRGFLAAGHETTASLLVWATYLFTQRPDVTVRLRAEITALLARKPEPEYSDMESLPYLKNFTREMLRWRCPAISAPREAVEDVVIQGVRIPKGTTVLMLPAIIQHNPTIWGEDCDKFDPDRWDRLDGVAADHHAFAAFMQGPRMCIGKVMTLIEFKVIMIEILKRFDFGAIGNGEVELVNPSPLLRPKGGLKVVVKSLSY